MTNLKEFLSSVLALAMSATLAAPAFAETLTVSVNSADILGSTVNVDASDAEVETDVQPEVLLYRDYEDYTGGSYVAAFKDWTAHEKSKAQHYGVLPLGVNGSFMNASEVATGADGKGFYTQTAGSNNGHGMQH